MAQYDSVFSNSVLLKMTKEQDLFIDSPISVEEVEKYILKLRDGKSPLLVTYQEKIIKLF